MFENPQTNDDASVSGGVAEETVKPTDDAGSQADTSQGGEDDKANSGDEKAPREKKDGFDKSLRRKEGIIHSQRARIAELEAQINSARDSKVPDGKLKVEDFPDFDAYLDAKFEQKQATESKSKAEGQYEAVISERLDDVIEMGRETYDDFDKVTGKTAYPPSIKAIIADSDIGHELAYHLATNPDEYRRILRMSDRQQAYEMGRLESSIEAAGKRKETSAPNPPARNTGKSGNPKKRSEMTDKEYRAQRLKEMRGG